MMARFSTYAALLMRRCPLCGHRAGERHVRDCPGNLRRCRDCGDEYHNIAAVVGQKPSVSKWQSLCGSCIQWEF